MLTSSKEEQDLLRSYELGVNAYVVKPVDFNEFVRAIADLGIFWAVLNEPPPGSHRYVKPGQVSLRQRPSGHWRPDCSLGDAPRAAGGGCGALSTSGVVRLLQQVDRGVDLALVGQHAFGIAGSKQHLRRPAAWRARGRAAPGC